MTRAADLLEQALTIYQREGQSGVERWAEQAGIAAHIVMLFCDACEDHEPHINDICAVCWTVHRPDVGFQAVIDRPLADGCAAEFLQSDGYGEEAVLRLVSGYTLRTDAGQIGDSTFGGDYVRVLDANDREIGYWQSDEWRDDPLVVMGAIFGAASGLSSFRSAGNG